VTSTTRPSSRPSAKTSELIAPEVYADGYLNPQSGNTSFMQIPGVHIETLHNPVRYTYAQIERACAIAQLLNRGKLVLIEPPRR
jgi:hypothetical protein